MIKFAQATIQQKKPTTTQGNIHKTTEKKNALFFIVYSQRNKTDLNTSLKPRQKEKEKNCDLKIYTIADKQREEGQ